MYFRDKVGLYFQERGSWTCVFPYVHAMIEMISSSHTRSLTFQDDKHARCTYNIKDSLTYQSIDKHGQRKTIRRTKPTKITKFEEVYSASGFVLSCLVLSCLVFVLSCLLFLPCLALSCLVVSCLVLSCFVLPCLCLVLISVSFAHTASKTQCGCCRSR